MAGQRSASISSSSETDLAGRRSVGRGSSLFALILTMFVNMYAIASVFPYSGSMVVFFGKAGYDDAGTYAGFLASSFFIGRLSTAFLWGIASDTFGRRPVLIVGCVAMGIAQFIFGLATSFEMAVACRFLLGAFNGVVGTAKTVCSELVPADDPALQSKAMSYIMVGASFGTLVGPAIGGWTTAMPGSPLYSEALKTVPFFLPNLFGSIVACVAGVLVYCFLPETLVGKREGDVPYGNVGDGTGESDDPETETGDVELVGTAAARDSDKEEGSVSNDTGKKLREDEVQIELSISARDSLRSSTDFAPVGVTAATDIDLRPRLKALPCGRRCRQIFGACTNREALAMIGLYSAHSFLAMFLDEMWPLWCLATPAVDGLGSSISEIGTMVSVAGICLLIYQLLVYPRLCCSTSRIFALACALLCPIVILTPIIPQGNIENGQPASIPVLVGVGFMRSLEKVAEMSAFTSVFILINNSADTRERGAVNGLSMMLASISKALGPVAGAEFFAYSVRHGSEPPFSAAFPFVLCGLAWLLLGAFSLWFLRRLG